MGDHERARFLEFYERYVTDVWRWVGRLGVAAHARDDVVQEVFVKLYELSDAFEGRSSLKTWCYAVTLGVVRNFRRRRSLDTGDEGQVDAIADDAMHPEELATQNEAMTLLQAILDGLDEDKREIFVLAELEQMTANEIGKLLGISSNTVASRLRHARAEVRANWERAKLRDTWNLR